MRWRSHTSFGWGVGVCEAYSEPVPLNWLSGWVFWDGNGTPAWHVQYQNLIYLNSLNNQIQVCQKKLWFLSCACFPAQAAAELLFQWSDPIDVHFMLQFSPFPQNHPWCKIRKCKWSQDLKEQICSGIRRGRHPVTPLLFSHYNPIKFFWIDVKCPYIRVQWNITTTAEIRCKGIRSREDFSHCWWVLR